MAAGRGLVAVLPETAFVTRTFWLVMHEDMRRTPRVRLVWEWLKTVVAGEQNSLFGRW
jgi:DNA-binding transcriptional LysR family regulator